MVLTILTAWLAVSLSEIIECDAENPAWNPFQIQWFPLPPFPFSCPPPPPTPFPLQGFEFGVWKKKKPSLFFTWIGSSNQIKILGWCHVIISCLSSVLPSTLPSYKPCCSLLGAHAYPRFEYSQEILHNFPYAAPCHGLLGQVSCCCWSEGLQDLNREMTD